MSSSTFTRGEVQGMLDAAQLNAGVLFSNIVSLRDQLQKLFQENLMECNSQDIDPINLLLQVLNIERTILDAYNKHRLGMAVTAFNRHALDSENAIVYNEEDNIPEQLEFFPLRAEVVRCGIDVAAPPIYQSRVTVEDSQQYTDKPAVFERRSTARPEATPKKTVNRRSPAKEKKSTGFGSANYDKFRDAPSAWLGLPHGNLTLAEMTAFIPHAIKSYDIMDRFLYNGALSGTFADMINKYRHMPYGPITNNTIYRMMKGPMNHRSKYNSIYKRWTVAKHATIPKPDDFDPTSVSVAGFCIPVNFNSRQSAAAATQPPPSILFRDMANGVETMPSGYDALDLTRCVEYCVEHNEERWRYPRDFEKLVAQLGGAATVYREHQDGAAILRHTSEKKRMKAKRAAARQRGDHGRLLKQKDSFVVDSDEEAALSEGSGESEEDLDDLDSDVMDGDEPKPTTKPSAKRKDAFRDDISDEDDENYEQTLNGRAPKRSRTLPAKTWAHRSKKPSPSRSREKVLPKGIDSESDGDTYTGPKRRNKEAVVATRSSTRNRPFSSSYIIEKVLETEDEEEGEEDEDDSGISDDYNSGDDDDLDI